MRQAEKTPPSGIHPPGGPDHSSNPSYATAALQRLKLVLVLALCNIVHEQAEPACLVSLSKHRRGNILSK